MKSSAFNLSNADINLLQSLKTAEDIRIYMSNTNTAEKCEVDELSGFEFPFKTLASIIAKIFNVLILLILLDLFLFFAVA